VKKLDETQVIAELTKELQFQKTLLREAKAQADALISSIGEGVIATDEKGNIVQINQVALDILGYKRGDLLGEWLPKKLIALNEDGSKVDQLERPAMKVFMTGELVSENLYYRRADGGKVPVSITASPIFLRHQPIGVIEIFRDITREIEADRAKSEFISLASHQLRTPLSSIGLYSHMLKDGYAKKLNKEQEEILDVILSATTRMNDLINSLLNITRIESDSILIKSEPIDITATLNKLLLEFKPQMVSRKIVLSRNIAKKIPIINSDNVIIGEILNNLISNAVKYTPIGGAIKVSALMDGLNILIKISDTGYGIPLQSQPYIFNKFFRASNILKNDVTGTGLGLYFTKALAVKINCNVWFESDERVGTTFFFSVPITGTVARDGKFNIEQASVIKDTEE
jgi:PAS domain S-box-containing protein